MDPRRTSLSARASRPAPSPAALPSCGARPVDDWPPAATLGPCTSRFRRPCRRRGDMTAYRPHVYSQDGDGSSRPSPESADQVPILGAVREDIRQTLRTGWIDPALDAVAAH